MVSKVFTKGLMLINQPNRIMDCKWCIYNTWQDSTNGDNSLTLTICWFFLLKKMVSGWWHTYPSEKWWSSSVGMMPFPIYMKRKHVPKPPTSIHRSNWVSEISSRNFWFASRKMDPKSRSFTHQRWKNRFLSPETWTGWCLFNSSSMVSIRHQQSWAPDVKPTWLF